MKRLFSRRQRTTLRLVAGNQCQICGVKLSSNFHADHKKPFNKGGMTTLENGQALCATCNLKKGSKDAGD